MERLDKHFKMLTRAAFERHGFAYGEILAQWEAIIGERLARRTRPLRIKWPRQEGTARKAGGLLLVQAEPGFAIELHYEGPRLIERLNGYFGYGAIAAIKIVPGSFKRRNAGEEKPPLPAAGEEEALKQYLAGIGDGGLKDALLRLGLGIRSQKQG
jgi:hypothetical protein